MSLEAPNQNISNSDDFSSTSLEDTEDMSKLINELSTRPPTVHNLQLALLKKMKDYGIEAIWKAISSNLKYEVEYAIDNTTQPIIHPRITKESFLKQVTRLKDYSPTNEKMTFAVRGNILLLMNIFEILGIKTVNDLLDTGFIKPDIESLIIAANVNSEILQRRFDSLQDTINLSLKKKSRLSNIKVCRDWEQILIKVNNLIYNYNNQNNIISIYTAEYSNEIKFSFFIQTLLIDYTEYYVKDLLLHHFVDSIGKMQQSLYVNGSIYTSFSPLYLLYFIINCHIKFINTFPINRNMDNGINYSPFMHTKLDNYNNEVVSEDVKKLLDGKSLTAFIITQSKEMLLSIKGIINASLQYHNIISKSYFDELLELTKDTIELYSAIYNNDTKYNIPYFLLFMKSVSSLNDLYYKLSLGNPMYYILTEAQINYFISLNERISSFKSRLTRLIL